MQADPIPTLTRMEHLLKQWEVANDNRAIFLNCYRLMTVNTLEAIRLREFHDPAWVNNLLDHFAGYYFHALDTCEQGLPNAPAIWQQVFETVNRSDTHVLQHLLLGVNAHINYDLILTLVDMLKVEWKNLSVQERRSRYEDHSLVNKVIHNTVDVVQDTVIEPRQPLMDIVDRLMGPVDEWAVSTLIRAWRDQVWQDAVALLEAVDVDEFNELRQKAETAALQRGRVILKML